MKRNWLLLTSVLISTSFILFGFYCAYDEIIEDYVFEAKREVAVRRHPKDPDTLLKYASFLALNRRYPEAIGILGRYHEVARPSAETLQMLGKAHSLSGDDEIADIYYKRARKLKTDSLPEPVVSLEVYHCRDEDAGTGGWRTCGVHRSQIVRALRWYADEHGGRLPVMKPGADGDLSWMPPLHLTWSTMRIRSGGRKHRIYSSAQQTPHRDSLPATSSTRSSVEKHCPILSVSQISYFCTKWGIATTARSPECLLVNFHLPSLPCSGPPL